MKKAFASILALVLSVLLMVPTMAAPSDFVPSAEIKGAPNFIEHVLPDGTVVIGNIVMPDGASVSVPKGEIIITPLLDADTAEPSIIGEQLNQAYKELLNAESLKDIIPNIDEIIAQIDKDARVEDMVITQLFHVYFSDEYLKYLDEGGVLAVTFDADDAVMLGLLNSNGEWSALFGDDLIDNGDGTYTIRLRKPGVIALLKNASSVSVNPDAPDVSSPTTSDSTSVYMTLFVVFFAASVAFVLASKKQKA